MNRPKIGFFGGTFDPPHLGHLVLAAEALFQLKLESVRWILTPDPPHKTNRLITPQHLRQAMLEAELKTWDHFLISRVELERKPPLYAADTVEILQSRYPESDLVYIIGEDSLRDLPTWHQPGRFLKAIDVLAVAPRPGVRVDLEDLERMLPGLSGKVASLSGVNLEISSTVIRQRCARGEPYRHLLTEPVFSFITEQGLYQAASFQNPNPEQI